MKKLLFGAAALVLSCSLASAGEGKFTVDVGLDIGVVESLYTEIDGDDLIDSSTMSIIPRVSGTYHFDENWSASLAFRAVVGFEDDDAEIDGEDGESTFREINFGGSGGYTFKVNDQFEVTPVFGLTWRKYTVDVELDSGGDGDVETSLLVLDFGAKMALAVNDQVSITGGLMFGIPVTGDSEFDGPDVDGDLEGGFYLEIDGSVEYKLNDNVALVGGLAYELGRLDWEWESTVDGEDELDRFAIKLGAVFSF
jgi:hypothetical protein